MWYICHIMVFVRKENYLEKLGAYFKRVRINRHLTQQDVADVTGIDRHSISRFENGGNINLENFISLLDAVNKLELLDQFLQEPVLDPRVINREKKPRSRVRKNNNEQSDYFDLE